MLPAVPKGQQEKALDDATFAAKKGKLVGPVKTQFGYYVFEVTKITPGSQQTLDQSKATIKQLLASQNQQKKLNEFVKDFQKKWKDRTDCRKGYVDAGLQERAEEDDRTTATAGHAAAERARRQRRRPPAG